MNFVLVPNGSFDRKLPGKDSIQRVNLTSSFLLMDSEVTNKHFRAYRPQHNSGLTRDIL